jgi:hypothetical protein
VAAWDVWRMRDKVRFSFVSFLVDRERTSRSSIKDNVKCLQSDGSTTSIVNTSRAMCSGLVPIASTWTVQGPMSWIEGSPRIVDVAGSNTSHGGRGFPSRPETCNRRQNRVTRESNIKATLTQPTNASEVGRQFKVEATYQNVKKEGEV